MSGYVRFYASTGHDLMSGKPQRCWGSDSRPVV